MGHRGNHTEPVMKKRSLGGIFVYASKDKFGCVILEEEEPIAHCAYYGEFMEEMVAFGLPIQRDFHQ